MPSPQPGPSGFGESYRRLGAAQKKRSGVSLYSRYVNRPAGRVFAAAAYVIGLTPNGVTALSGLTTAAGYVLVATVRPGFGMAVLVYRLTALGFALDAADGQLARLRGGGSLSGEWLDHVLDCAKMVGANLAIYLSLNRFFHPDNWLLAVALAFQLVAVVTFFAGTLTELLKHRLPATGTPAPADAGSAITVRSLALLPADYGVFCLVLLLLGWRAGFLVGYTALFCANVVLMVALLVKWFRELSG